MFEDNIKLSCFRGPEAKMGLVFANHFRADRVATLYTRHREQTWRSSPTKQPRSWAVGCPVVSASATIAVAASLWEA